MRYASPSIGSLREYEDLYRIISRFFSLKYKNIYAYMGKLMFILLYYI